MPNGLGQYSLVLFATPDSIVIMAEFVLDYRQWLPRDKLEPLGVDPDRDKAKLIESKKQTERKAVKKAFEEAILHQCRVAGQSSALSEDSDSSH